MRQLLSCLQRAYSLEGIKQAKETRGCARAGLRIHMYGVPWEHKGKTSNADQGRLLGRVDKQMGT